MRGEGFGFAEVSIRRDHVEGTSAAPVPYLEAWYLVPPIGERVSAGHYSRTPRVGASEAGFSELASDAASDNHDAIRLHAGLGFSEVGRSVHFVKPLRAPKP